MAIEDDIQESPERVKSTPTITSKTSHRRKYRAELRDLDFHSLSPEDKLKEALEHRLSEACFERKSDGSMAYRSVWNTVPKDLGKYGVGVQLYFEYYWFVAVVMLVLFVLALPMMIMNSMGSLISDHPSLAEESFLYRFLASMSIGNLGTCEMPSCNVNIAANLRERKLTKDGTTKVESLTEALGILDGIGVLFFLSAGMYFAHRWIPMTVKSQDENNVTAADYAIRVEGLPRWIHEPGDAVTEGTCEAHKKYQDDLKQHFIKVLKLEFDETIANGGVREVTLIRDYNGAIGTFMAQGSMLKEMDRFEECARISAETGNTIQAEALTLKKQELEDSAKSLDVQLEEQTILKDEDRAVMQAFIMFDSEELKDSVLDKYTMSRSKVFWRFQRAPLTFRKHQLRVFQAHEPDEMFWENLDYPHKRRDARRYFFSLLTIMLLLLNLVVAGKLTSLPSSSAKFTGSKIWVFQGQANQDSCAKVCHPEISEDAKCESFRKVGVGQEQNIYTSCCSSQTITNSTVDTCLAQSSATCSKTSFVVVDYGSLVTPFCFKLVMPREQSTAFKTQEDSFKIYGCGSGFTANDDPSQNCHLMSIEEFTQTLDASAAIDTVRLRLGLHAGCDGSTPTIEKAKAAKAMLGSEQSVEDSRLNCFCNQEYKKQGTFFLLRPYDTEEKQLCNEWSKIQSSAKLQYFLGISLVVVTNGVLWLVITIFDDLLKHRSLSSATNSQMVWIMASQFVNTGLLLLLVSLNTYGLFSNFGFVKDWVGVGPHDDFTTAWHTQNGSSLIVTLGSIIACGFAISVASVWPTVPLFVWWFKKGAVTRKTMDKLYLLPQFGFSSRLAASNCFLFVVVMYSGAMPILYLLGFFYFVGSYWIDKWCLLCGSSRPPAYNEEAVALSVTMWSSAAFLHVVMVCAMFTPSVFPSGWSWLKDIVFDILSEDDQLYSETLLIWGTSPRTVRSDYYGDWTRGRFSDVGRRCCWLQFFILAVFCIIFASTSIYRFVLKPWFNFCDVIGEHLSMCRRKSKATSENYDLGLASAKESNLVFSYDLKASKSYADAYHALQYDPDPIHYSEVIQGKSKAGILGSKRVSAHRVDRANIDGGLGGLIVTIQGAKGLRKADMLSESDPFCKCVVIGKPESAFKTNTVRDDCNPDWFYERHVPHWAPGDGLRFEVFDSNEVLSSEKLGRAEFSPEFTREGFEGELDLLEAGEGITATIRVKVEVLGLPDRTSM